MSPERPEALRVALRVFEVFGALGIDFHLGGSWASSIHGVPRQTQDVDLVADIAPDRAAKLVGRLGSGFYADGAQELGVAELLERALSESDAPT